MASSDAGGILRPPRRMVAGGGTPGGNVEGGVDAPAGQQRRQRRREPDPVGVFGHVERLDAEPVATEQHPAAVAFDDGESEHAFEVADEVVAPAGVGLEQNLAVAVREEAVAVALKLGPQFLVVVDATVPDDGQTEVGIDHRLSAGFSQVNDFETTVTESDSTLRPNARSIRSSRRHHGGHRRDRRYIRRSTVESHLTGGSTHVNNPTEVDYGARAADRPLQRL